MRWLQFILSHSIFVSVCAAALCYQSFILFDIPLDHDIAALVFFSTLCSYNFYWMISRLHFSSFASLTVFIKRNKTNLFFFLLSGAAICFYLFHFPALMPFLLGGVILTLVYSIPLWPLKLPLGLARAGFFKTILLAFTWAYVTVFIPLHTLVFETSLSILLLFCTRFFFMLMLCIIFDSRDILVDKIHSLRSLATDVSPNTLRWIIGIVFVCYMSAGILLRTKLSDPRQLIAFLAAGLVTLLVYRLSLKKQGYIFYYFVVDGLMMFSALTTFLASIR